MKKIPTLFRRNPEDMRYVTSEVHPDCQWVLDGEGVATRKYDGTCVMLDSNGAWWARREVRRDKPRPTDFVAVQADPATGKTVGWEPIEQSPFFKFFIEAREHLTDPREGTYELCGPKINRNPEGYQTHTLVRHETAQQLEYEAHRDWDSIRDLVQSLEWEGVVWHHPDGRMAKLKGRDFPNEAAAEGAGDE